MTSLIFRRIPRLLRALFLVILAIPLAGADPRFDPQADLNYSRFNGKTIRSIAIEVREIFDDPDIGAPYRAVNKIKVNTRPQVVRRELLFTEGDKYDEFIRAESIRRLRALGYLRDVVVVPTVEGDFVDIVVRVKDTWTFLPEFNYSSGTGNRNISAGLAESNIFGYGKRFEVLASEDEGRRGIEAVWEDPRVLNSDARLLTGYFHRDDGERGVFFLGDPFRTLLQPTGWSVSADISDTIGRLFENGDERYIFGQRLNDIEARYTVSRGNPESTLYRYSFGYDYQSADFRQADADDYDALNLDPDTVSNDPDEVPENRKFTGPVLTIEKIVPEFISMAYIDRFERVADYNIGDDYSASFFGAPSFLGSDGNTMLFTANRSGGRKFDLHSFLRGELGLNTRVNGDGFENTLMRGEAKYYNVLGDCYAKDLFFGRHTLAAAFILDYGIDLDRDRELLVGSDNILRGYEAKTFTGDKRVGLNLEDRIHFIDDAFRLVSVGAAIFADVGGATNDSLSHLIGNRLYSDVGAGLRFAFPRSSGGKVLRVDIAFPLRDGPDGSDRFEPRILFSGGQLFGSNLGSESLGPEKANIAVGLDK